MKDVFKSTLITKMRRASRVPQLVSIGIALIVTLGQLGNLSAQAPHGQLLNSSARLPVLGGDNALIGGVIMTGMAPKKVIQIVR